MKRDYDLFEQTKIENPKNLERLVEILSSFHLSSVDADIKGMAFEHFIHSYTRGTKNDLGQYFTPRHIIKMMVHFLKPKIGETIYDPFCGTGGMLIECFRYINRNIDKPEDKQNLREETLFGRDNSNVAKIAMMNMIMFGDGHSNIEKGDSYASLGKTKGKYDIVITNIPFSQQTDFYTSYPVMPKEVKNGNSIAVQHCLESLKNTETARAAIIVPIGFLYKSELIKEREYIADNLRIERVVELSPKCFNPYTEQQTAVVMVSKKSPKQSFQYYQIKNDGYSQDGYRVPLLGENDIDKVLDSKNRTKISIKDSMEYQFKRINVHIRANEFQLAEIANIKKGNAPSLKTNPQYVHAGKYTVVMTADLAKKHINYCLTKSVYKLNDKAVKQENPCLFPKNTILIPTSGKSTLLNHRAMLGSPAYVASTITCIEAKSDRVHPYCLFYFFLTFDAEKVCYDLGYPGISNKVMEKLPIPNYAEREQDDIITRISELVEITAKLDAKHDEICLQMSKKKQNDPETGR